MISKSGGVLLRIFIRIGRQKQNRIPSQSSTCSNIHWNSLNDIAFLVEHLKRKSNLSIHHSTLYSTIITSTCPPTLLSVFVDVWRMLRFVLCNLSLFQALNCLFLLSSSLGCVNVLAGGLHPHAPPLVVVYCSAGSAPSKPASLARFALLPRSLCCLFCRSHTAKIAQFLVQCFIVAFISF